MPFKLQYTNDSASTFHQSDAVLTDDLLIYAYPGIWIHANVFHTIKDSNNTCYVLATSNYATYVYCKIFKITSDGKYVFSTVKDSYEYDNAVESKIKLSRDEKTIYFTKSGGNNDVKLRSISISDIGVVPTITNGTTLGGINIVDFDFYKDLYLWEVNVEPKLQIWNIEDNTKLHEEVVIAPLAFCGGFDSGDRVFAYAVNANEFIEFEYVSITNTIIPLTYTNTGLFANAKNMKMDIDGNLIILITPSSGNSSIIKMSRAGVQLGKTLTLVGLWAGIDSDIDGNVYWWKTEATIRSLHTSATSGVGAGSKVRETGLSTYGSNIAGYYPSIQA